ncbi:MAG: SDR family NAD(P)-dependent oxidoreductase [Lentisphaeria bacterium]|nr:SDR family NAD(P)-dependent oxidoreductase [Lentisphaeria bacterium]MDP7741088.1 SDR family NAD(P)-dependent oxidoreductase [Lentisphaeria bacterium]
MAAVQEFARRGAICTLVDIDADKVAAAADAVNEIDDRAGSYVLDVADKDGWEKMNRELVGRFGTIDILVNAAATYDVVPFEELTESQWDRVFAVNAKAVLFGCQAVAGPMKRQKSGRIINLSSQAGKTGGLLVGAHYSASKAAVICMTKTFATALAAHNITVNCVAPGIIQTDFLKGMTGVEEFFDKIPLGKMPGEPIDVAKAIAFLASDDARYITGEIIDVNGGLLMD